MNGNVKRKRASLWTRLYIAIVMAITIIGCLSLLFLWFFLAKYQSNVEAENYVKKLEELNRAERQELERAAQLSFQDFINEAGDEELIELWRNSYPDSPERDRDVAVGLKPLLNKDNSYYKAADYSEDRPSFLIKSGNTDLAVINMAGSGAVWKPETIRYLVPPKESIIAEVPSEYVILQDGKEISDSYGQEYQREFPLQQYAEALKDPVLMKSINCPLYFSEPSPEVKNDRGEAVEIPEDNICEYQMEASFSEPYISRAGAFVKAILYYYLMGQEETEANLAAALAYTVRDSQAYNLVKGSLEGVIYTGTGAFAVYGDVTADRAVKLAKNCFYVDVGYRSSLPIPGRNAEIIDSVCRVYFLDMGNGFGIYGLENL